MTHTPTTPWRTITIALVGGGTAQCAAFPTRTPGLVITRRMQSPDREWELLHERSGGVLAEFPDPEQAQCVAHLLAGVIDWTAPADQLYAVLDPAVSATIRSIIGRHEATTAGVVDAELNPVGPAI